MITGTIKLFVNEVMISDYPYTSFEQVCGILQRWRVGMAGTVCEAYVHIIPDIVEVVEDIKEVPIKKEVIEPRRKIDKDIKAKYVGRVYRVSK